MAPGDPSPERAWNTWDARFPGCYLHLPTGFCIRVSAYSARRGSFTEFRFDPASMRLGPHTTDGSFAEVELAHAGSRLRVRFGSLDGGAASAGDVEVLETAEWGLRFWYVLEVGFDRSFADDGVHVGYLPGRDLYVHPPVTLGSASGGDVVAFVLGERPVAASLYDDRLEVGREFEERGYYFRPPVRRSGRWAVFRFNAVTPRVAFAAAVARDGPGAMDAADSGLSRAKDLLGAAAARAAQAPPADAAMRDVLAWNTVWDRVNARPYTVATRSWAAEKFGGWFVWQMDAFLHAIMAAHAGDPWLAAANIDAALSCATQHGNLAGLRAGNTDWVDRSHPPIGAHAALQVHRLTGDRSVLERSYPILRRAFDWWFERRDGNADGLLEYGSSPVGDGHFVHTKQAAMDESANDNSPVHDRATFDTAAHTLDMEDVGLNSLLVYEGENLAAIARVLGLDQDAATLSDVASALAERIRNRLWDDSRGIFANRLWSGVFADSLAPTSFYPMLAGVATRDQAERMVRQHLMAASRFGGPHPVAGTPHEDPASLDNVYWRGRVWPPFNYLVAAGLLRYGYREEAEWLAGRGLEMFERGWKDRRSHENFNQRTGEGGDSPDSDPFYTWGALLALLPAMVSGQAFDLPGRG